MVLPGSNEERALAPRERAPLLDGELIPNKSWAAEYEMKSKWLTGDWPSSRMCAREIAVTITGS